MFDSLEVNVITQDLRAADRYFWRKPEFVTIDWKSSSAVYDGPRIVCRRDGGKEWPLFDYSCRAMIHANLVQFPVDIAIERLRLLRLAPSAVIPEPVSAPAPGPSPASQTARPGSAPAKRPGTLESDYAAALRTHPPKGKKKSEWAAEMAELHRWNAHAVQNWLARKDIDELWESLGGKPTSKKMRGSRGYNG
jgi:hypothetical protein